ncbi:MAG: AraC family transcriptional regulator [Winogradskyella sp.]|uniref:helix-turn-helix domain-containing protein n=1 Tax=Winogradskyella sp. TaxID=1883156 RepID=UPI000F41A6E9|nr:AraC family transcriptional regulator [Winogradskyella sp.]RNC80203.1 MAG: AraC family transcriptional regulator [Winogradskyella sp.]
MSYYQKKIDAIKDTLFPNQEQLETVIGIKNYIDNNYESDLNLDFISQKRFVSKFHLLRLFKRYYGQTPRQYLIDVRLKKSKDSLKNGISVTETCFAVGFQSLGSFSTLFKSRNGKSPSQFQKEQLSRSITNSDC